MAQKSVPTYFIWRPTGGADNKQLSQERGWGERSKIGKTNTGDVIKAKWQAQCENDWRVSSYLLLLGFQYQRHRKHIRCFSFRRLIRTNCYLYLMRIKIGLKRLIYRQTALNKQLRRIRRVQSLYETADNYVSEKANVWNHSFIF